MKTKKLLKKLSKYLNAERREQAAKYSSIKRILKMLKKKENALKEKLEKSDDPDVTAQLEKELDIVYTQRRKGIALKRALKQDKQN